MRVRWGGAPSLDLSISQLAELNLINDTNSGVKHSVTGGSVKGKDSSSAFPDWYVLLGVLHSYLLHSSSPFPIGMCRCHDTCPLSSFQVSLFLSLQVSAAVSLGGSWKERKLERRESACACLAEPPRCPHIPSLSLARPRPRRGSPIAFIAHCLHLPGVYD